MTHRPDPPGLLVYPLLAPPAPPVRPIKSTPDLSEYQPKEPVMTTTKMDTALDKLADDVAKIPSDIDAYEEEPPPIQLALSRVMADVQAVSKGQRVTSGPAQYAFRGVDDVVNAVGPALRAHGVIVLPRVLDRASETYQTTKGATMRRVELTVEFTFVGPAGDTLTCSVMGESSDSGDKAIPKAHSVAYRTALLQALCIPTHEPDPDLENHERVLPPVVEALGWASLEEQDEYFDGLRSATMALADDRAESIKDWLKAEGITRRTMTRHMAERWEARITTAASEPKPPVPLPIEDPAPLPVEG